MSIWKRRDIEIAGFHGCPFFNSALQVASALQGIGAIGEVTVIRAGHVHSPKWHSPKDIEPWTAFKAATFQSGSPRIVFDGDPKTVVDSSQFVKRYALALKGAKLGLPDSVTADPAFIETLAAEGASPIWKSVRGTPAYREFTSLDPPGKPKYGVMHGGFYFRDYGCTSGNFPPHDDFTYKNWKCGCGQVKLALEGEPYFNLDCHCSACTPVSRYLDAKGGGQGISAIVEGTGVAKAFYMLDKVTFVKGKELVRGVKLGQTGGNVRAYASCCGTLLIGDSPVPFAFRPFNRMAITEADGSPYRPGQCWGCKGGGNSWYDAIPEPKHPGDPAWLVAKVEALQKPGHGLGGLGSFEGDPTPGFFPDPASVDEYISKAAWS